MYISRVSKFREDLQGMRTRFEGLKKQAAAQQLEQNRDSLLARRGRHQTTTESSSVSVLVERVNRARANGIE